MVGTPAAGVMVRFNRVDELAAEQFETGAAHFVDHMLYARACPVDDADGLAFVEVGKV